MAIDNNLNKPKPTGQPAEINFSKSLAIADIGIFDKFAEAHPDSPIVLGTFEDYKNESVKNNPEAKNMSEDELKDQYENFVLPAYPHYRAVKNAGYKFPRMTQSANAWLADRAGMPDIAFPESYLAKKSVRPITEAGTGKWQIKQPLANEKFAARFTGIYIDANNNMKPLAEAKAPGRLKASMQYLPNGQYGWVYVETPKGTPISKGMGYSPKLDKLMGTGVDAGWLSAPVRGGVLSGIASHMIDIVGTGSWLLGMGWQKGQSMFNGDDDNVTGKLPFDVYGAINGKTYHPNVLTAWGNSVQNYGNSLVMQAKNEQLGFFDSKDSAWYTFWDGIGQMVGLSLLSKGFFGAGKKFTSMKYGPNISVDNYKKYINSIQRSNTVAMQASLFGGSLQSAGMYRDVMMSQGMDPDDVAAFSVMFGIGTYISETAIGANLMFRNGVPKSMLKDIKELSKEIQNDISFKFGKHYTALSGTAKNAYTNKVAKTYYGIRDKFINAHSKLDEMGGVWGTIGKGAIAGTEEGSEEIFEGFMHWGVQHWVNDHAKTQAKQVSDYYKGSIYTQEMVDGIPKFYREQNGNKIPLELDVWTAEQRDKETAKNWLSGNMPFKPEFWNFDEGAAAFASTFATSLFGLGAGGGGIFNRKQATEKRTQEAIKISIATDVASGIKSIQDVQKELGLAQAQKKLFGNDKQVASELIDMIVKDISVYADIIKGVNVINKQGLSMLMESDKGLIVDFVETKGKINAIEKALSELPQGATMVPAIEGLTDKEFSVDAINKMKEKLNQELLDIAAPQAADNHYSKRYTQFYQNALTTAAAIENQLAHQIYKKGLTELNNTEKKAIKEKAQITLNNITKDNSLAIEMIKLVSKMQGMTVNSLTEIFRVLTDKTQTVTNEQGEVQQGAVLYNKIKEVVEEHNQSLSLTDQKAKEAGTKLVDTLKGIETLEKDYDTLEVKEGAIKINSIVSAINEFIANSGSKGMTVATATELGLPDLNDLSGRLNNLLEKHHAKTDAALKEVEDNELMYQQTAASLQIQDIQKFNYKEKIDFEKLLTNPSSVENSQDLFMQGFKRMFDYKDMDGNPVSFEKVLQDIDDQIAAGSVSNVDQRTRELHQMKEWMKVLEMFRFMNYDMFNKETGRIDGTSPHNYFKYNKNKLFELNSTTNDLVKQYLAKTLKRIDKILDNKTFKQHDSSLRQDAARLQKIGFDYSVMSIMLDVIMDIKEQHKDVANKIDELFKELEHYYKDGKIGTLTNKITLTDKEKELYQSETFYEFLDKLFAEMNKHRGSKNTDKNEGYTRAVEILNQVQSDIIDTLDGFGGKLDFLIKWAYKESNDKKYGGRSAIQENEDYIFELPLSQTVGESLSKQENGSATYMFMERMKRVQSNANTSENASYFRNIITFAQKYNRFGVNNMPSLKQVYAALYEVSQEVTEEIQTAIKQDKTKELQKRANVWTIEQEEAIIQLVGFMLNPNQENDIYNNYTHLYSKVQAILNTLNLRGFAAAGKTTEVLLRALQVYNNMTGKDAPIKLTVVTPQTALLESHKNNLGKIGFNQENVKYLTINEFLEKGTTDEFSDLIVFDEGSVYSDEVLGIDMFGEPSKQKDTLYNRMLQYQKSKKIVISDDFQTSGANKILNLSVTYMMREKTQPLTEMFRTGDTSIHSLNDTIRLIHQIKAPFISVPHSIKKDANGEFRGIHLVYDDKNSSDAMLKAFLDKYDSIVSKGSVPTYSDLMLIVENTKEYQTIISSIETLRGKDEAKKLSSLLFTLEFDKSNPELLVSGLSSDNVFMYYRFMDDQSVAGTEIEGEVAQTPESLNRLRKALTGTQRTKKSLYLLTTNTENYTRQQRDIEQERLGNYSESTNFDIVEFEFRALRNEDRLEVFSEGVAATEGTTTTPGEGTSPLAMKIAKRNTYKTDEKTLSGIVTSLTDAQTKLDAEKESILRNRANNVKDTLQNISKAVWDKLFPNKESNESERLRGVFMRYIIEGFRGVEYEQITKYQKKIDTAIFQTGYLAAAKQAIESYNATLEEKDRIKKETIDGFMITMIRSMENSTLSNLIKDSGRTIISPLLSTTDKNGNVVYGMPMMLEVLATYEGTDGKTKTVVNLHEIKGLVDLSTEPSEYDLKKIAAYIQILSDNDIVVKDVVLHKYKNVGAKILAIATQNIQIEELGEEIKWVKQELGIGKSEVTPAEEVLHSIYNDRLVSIDRSLLSLHKAALGINRFSKYVMVDSHGNKNVVDVDDIYLTSNNEMDIIVEFSYLDETGENIIQGQLNLIDFKALTTPVKNEKKIFNEDAIRFKNKMFTSKFTFSPAIMPTIAAKQAAVPFNELFKIISDDQISTADPSHKYYTFAMDLMTMMREGDVLELEYTESGQVISHTDFKIWNLDEDKNIVYVKLTDDFITKNIDRISERAKVIFGIEGVENVKEFIKKERLNIVSNLTKVEFGYDTNRTEKQSKLIASYLNAKTEAKEKQYLDEARELMVNGFQANKDNSKEENIAYNIAKLKLLKDVYNKKVTQLQLKQLDNGRLYSAKEDVPLSNFETVAVNSGYEIVKDSEGNPIITTSENKYGEKRQVISLRHKSGAVVKPLTVEVYAEQLVKETDRISKVNSLEADSKAALENIKKAIDPKNEEEADFSQLSRDFRTSPIYQFILANANIIIQNELTNGYITYIDSEGKYSFGNTLYQKVHNVLSIINELKKKEYDSKSPDGKKLRVDIFEEFQGQGKTQRSTEIGNLKTPYNGVTSLQVLLSTEQGPIEKQGNKPAPETKAPIKKNGRRAKPTNLEKQVDSEALSQFTISEEEVKKQVRKLLGDYADEFSNFEKIYSENRRLAGQILGRLMEFYKHNGMYHKVVGYHEAFHFLMLNLLSPKQFNEVLEDIKNELGEQWDGTLTHLLEHAATQFEQYIPQDNILGKTKTLWRRFVHFLKDIVSSIVGGKNLYTLSDLMYDSYMGKYANGQLVSDSDLILNKDVKDEVLTNSGTIKYVDRKLGNVLTAEILKRAYIFPDILSNSYYSKEQESRGLPFTDAIRATFYQYREEAKELNDLTHELILDKKGNLKPLKKWEFSDIQRVYRHYKSINDEDMAQQWNENYNITLLGNKLIYKALLKKMYVNSDIKALFQGTGDSNGVAATNTYSDAATSISMNDKTSDTLNNILYNIPIVKNDKTGTYSEQAVNGTRLKEQLISIFNNIRETVAEKDITFDVVQKAIMDEVKVLRGKKQIQAAVNLESFLAFFGDADVSGNMFDDTRYWGYTKLIKQYEQEGKNDERIYHWNNIISQVIHYFLSQDNKTLITVEQKGEKSEILEKTGTKTKQLQAHLKASYKYSMFDETGKVNSEVKERLKALGYSFKEVEGSIIIKVGNKTYKTGINEEAIPLSVVRELAEIILGIDISDNVASSMLDNTINKSDIKHAKSEFNTLAALAVYAINNYDEIGISKGEKSFVSQTISSEKKGPQNTVHNLAKFFERIAKNMVNIDEMPSSFSIRDGSGRTAYTLTYGSNLTRIKNELARFSTYPETIAQKFSPAFIKNNNILNGNIMLDPESIATFFEIKNSYKGMGIDELSQKDILDLIINRLAVRSFWNNKTGSITLPFEIFADKKEIILFKMMLPNSTWTLSEEIEYENEKGEKEKKKVGSINKAEIVKLYETIFNYHANRYTERQQYVLQYFANKNIKVENGEIEMTEELKKMVEKDLMHFRDYTIDKERGKIVLTDLKTDVKNIFNLANLIKFKSSNNKYETLKEIFKSELDFLNGTIAINNFDVNENFMPKEALTELVFFAYNIMNESLNQIYYGDISTFKTLTDYIKRRTGLAAPGTSFYLNNKYGLAQTSRFVVFEDISGYMKQFGITEGVPNKLLSDGATIVSPLFYEQMRNSTGGEFSVIGESSVKTVANHYNAETGEKIYLKHNMFQITFDDFKEQRGFYSAALRYMLGDKIFQEFINQLDQTGNWNKARENTLKYVVDKGLQNEVIDFVTFSSSYKTTLKGLQRFEKIDETKGTTYDNIRFPKRDETATQILDNTTLLHQSVSSNKTNIEVKNIFTQLVALVQIGKNNVKIANKINDARAKIAEIGVEYFNGLSETDKSQLHTALLKIANFDKTDPTGTFMQMALDSGINIDAVAEMHIKNILKEMNKYIHVSFEGLTATLKPSLTNYFVDEQGIFHNDVNEKQKSAYNDRGLMWQHYEDEKGNVIDDVANHKGTMVYVPAEVAMPFIQRKKFAVADDQSLAEIMLLGTKNKINLNLDHKGKKELLEYAKKYIPNYEKMSEFEMYRAKIFAYLSENDFVNKNYESDLTVEQYQNLFELLPSDDIANFIFSTGIKYTLGQRQEIKNRKAEGYIFSGFADGIKTKDFVNAMANYYYKLNKSLDVVLVAIPTNNPGTAAFGRIVMFKNNQGNTVEFDARSAEIHSKDFDFDNFHIFIRPEVSKKKKRPEFDKARQDIFDAVEEYYNDVNNAPFVLGKINLVKAKKAIKNKQKQDINEVGIQTNNVRQDVVELFESDKELANVVYEALENRDLKFTIPDKSTNRPTSPTLFSNKEELYERLKEEYEGVKRGSLGIQHWIDHYYSAGLQVWSEDKRQMFVDTLKDVIKNYYNNNFKPTESQKQQAQQLYSQYVEQTGKQDIEGFKRFVKSGKSINNKVDNLRQTQFHPNTFSTFIKQATIQYAGKNLVGHMANILSFSSAVKGLNNKNGIATSLKYVYSDDFNTQIGQLISTLLQAATDNAKEDGLLGQLNINEYVTPFILGYIMNAKLEEGNNDIEEQLYDLLLNDQDLVTAINNTYYGSTKMAGKKRELASALRGLSNESNKEKINKYLDYIYVGEQVRSLGEIFKLISGLKNEPSEVEATLNRISNYVGSNLNDYINNREKYKTIRETSTDAIEANAAKRKVMIDNQIDYLIANKIINPTQENRVEEEHRKRELFNIAEIVANNDYLFNYLNIVNSTLGFINQSFESRLQDIRAEVYKHANKSTAQVSLGEQTTNNNKAETTNKDSNTNTEDLSEDNNEDNEVTGIGIAENTITNKQTIKKIDEATANLYYMLGVKHSPVLSRISIQQVSVASEIREGFTKSFNFDLSKIEDALALIYLAPDILSSIKANIKTDSRYEKLRGNKFITRLQSESRSPYIRGIEMVGSKNFSIEQEAEILYDFNKLEEIYPEAANFFYAYHILFYGQSTRTGTFIKFMGDTFARELSKAASKINEDVKANKDKYAAHILFNNPEMLPYDSEKALKYYAKKLPGYDFYVVRELDGTEKSYTDMTTGKTYVTKGSTKYVMPLQSLNLLGYDNYASNQKVYAGFNYQEAKAILLTNKIYTKYNAKKTELKVEDKSQEDISVSEKEIVRLRNGATVEMQTIGRVMTVIKQEAINSYNKYKFTPTGKQQATMMRHKAAAEGVVEVLSNIINRNNPNVSMIVSNDVSGYGDVVITADNKILIRVNTNKINLETPLHELGHIIYAIVRATNPSLYEQLRSDALTMIEKNTPYIQKIREGMQERGLDLDELIEEVVVSLAGMHSAEKVENYFKINNIVGMKPNTLWDNIKSLASRILKSLQSFFGMKDVSMTTSIKKLSEMIYDSVANGNSLGLDIDNMEMIVDILKQTTKQQTFIQAKSLKEFNKYIANANSVPGIKNLTEDEKIKSVINQIKYRANKVVVKNGKEYKFDYPNDQFVLSNKKLVEDIKELYFTDNNTKDVDNLLKLLNSGESISTDKIKEIWGANKYDSEKEASEQRPSVSQSVIEHIAYAMDYNPLLKRKYIRYSDIKNHPKLSHLFDEDLVDYNPILSIAENIETGEFYISIYDVTSASIAGQDHGMNPRMKNILSNIRRSQKIALTNMYGDRSQLNNVMIANHLTSDKNVRIGEIGIIQFFPFANPANAVKPVLMDKVIYRREIQKLKDEDAFMSNLSPKLQQLLTSDKFISEHADYEKFLIYFYKNMFESMSNKVGLYNITNGKNDVIFETLSFEEKVEILKFRLDYLTKQKNPNVDVLNEIKYINDALKQLTTISVDYTQLNSRRESDLLDRMISPTAYIMNEDVQYIIDITRKTSMKIVDKLNAIKDGTDKRRKKGLNDFVDYFLKKNQSLKTRVVDAGASIFDELFAKVEANQNGTKVMKNSGFILWTTDKNEDPLFYKQAQKLDSETLQWGRWLVELITDTHAELLYHNKKSINFVSNQKYTLADAYYELGVMPPSYVEKNPSKEKLNELSKSAYKKGMIPIMRKTLGEKLAEGNIFSFLKRRIEHLSDNYALFEDIASLSNNDLNMLDEMPNVFGKQLGIGASISEMNILGMNKEVKAMLGLEVIGDDIYVIDDKVNNDMSRDLETIMGYFILANTRKQMYEDNMLPIMNGIRAQMNLEEKYKGKEHEQTRELIKDFFITGVLGKRKVINENLDATLRSSIAFGNFVLMPLNVNVGIVSLIHNMIIGGIEGLANKIAGTENYTFGDIMKATGVAMSNFGKVMQVMVDMQVMSMDEYDIVKHKMNTKTKSHLLSDFTSNFFNWGPDYVIRGVLMTAQMMHEGTWNAISITKSGESKYDYKKDGRFFTDGKANEKQKALLEAYKTYMQRDGIALSEDGKGIIKPYLYEEVRRIKVLSDKIAGAYSPQEKNMMNMYSLGALGSMFKTFVWVKVQNALGKQGFLSGTGKLVVEKDENGNYIPKMLREEFGGYINTSFNVFVRLAKTKDKAKMWKNLSAHERYSLTKFMLTIITYGLCYSIYGLMTDDRENKLRKYGKGGLKATRLVKNWKYAYESFLIFPLLIDIATGKTFPAFSLLQKSLGGIPDLDFSGMKYLIPGRGTYNTVAEYFE